VCFSSKWLPCDFCKAKNIREPCFKLFGPQTEALLNPSRPIPTAIDAVIEPEDVLLLQYAYSRPSEYIIWLIINRLGLVYGQSLPSPGLRHAVLAVAAAEIGSPQFFNQYQCHKSQMYRELAAKIKDLALITETDIFASFLFMALKQSTREEKLNHAKGCLAMIRALLDEIKRGKHVSDFFSVCAPLLCRVLNFFLTSHELNLRKEVQFPNQILYLERGIVKGVDALTGSNTSQKVACIVVLQMLGAFATVLKIVKYNLKWTPSMECVVQNGVPTFERPGILPSSPRSAVPLSKHFGTTQARAWIRFCSFGKK
jgi:hypothetical protein